MVPLRPKSDGNKRLRISAAEMPRLALEDLWGGLLNSRVWWTLALYDIRDRFRRSILGPFWLTVSMGVTIAALGFVFLRLFKQDPSTFLPYLSVGLIFWGFITSVINDGCQAFIVSEGYIRNLKVPLSVHFYRMFARNIIILAANMVIYVFVALYFSVPLSYKILLFIPAFLLLVLNLAWMSLAAAIISTRYRDISQITANILQVIFFVTPIFWTIDSLPDRPAFILLNPFHHLLELVRAPLLDRLVEPYSWTTALALLTVGLPFTLLLYRRAYARLPYWV